MDLNDFNFEEVRGLMRNEAVAAIEQFEIEELDRDGLFKVGVEMSGICNVSYAVVFLMLMQSYPQDTAILALAGDSLKKLEDYHSAANVFEALCELAPDNAFAHISYAENLIELGEYDEAGEAIDAVLKLGDTDTDLFMKISGLNQRKAIRLAEVQQTAHAHGAHEDALYYAQQAVKKGAEEATPEDQTKKFAAETWLKHLEKNPPGQGGEELTLNM